MNFHDLIVAARVLRKSPIFVLTAVLTIALGIGASTAIFSVTNAVLLRPLPYRDPDRLVVACSDLRKRNVRDFPLSNANFIDLRDGTKSVFDDLAGVLTFPLTLQREDGSPEQTNAAVVTINFFRLLGGSVAYGRDFNDDDAVPNPAAPPPGAQQPPPRPQLAVYAILSFEYFQRRYGGDLSMLGRSISIAGQQTAIIVGVLRPHFQLYFPPEAQVLQAPDIWIANRLSYDAAQRNGVSIHAVGRLRPGVTPEHAQAEAEKVAASERAQFPIMGTADYHIGSPPDTRSQRAALRRGIDLSGLRARQVVPHDFACFDLILAMDRDNLRLLEAMRPAHSRARVQLFLEYAPELDRLDVPDPYYGNANGFEEVLDLTAAASRGLISSLQKMP